MVSEPKTICPMYGKGVCRNCALTSTDVICPVWNPEGARALTERETHEEGAW